MSSETRSSGMRSYETRSSGTRNTETMSNKTRSSKRGVLIGDFCLENE
ncbi:MAG: hypothetical protein FWH55_08735 [Oscillospiraceae bacterium]|nr:hypothetical protein [Oscillospiraceae bacterium]